MIIIIFIQSIKYISEVTKIIGLLQHTIDNKVSALVTLTFYENLSIGQETSVHRRHYWVSVLSGLNFEKMYGLFPGTKKTVRNNEVSLS